MIDELQSPIDILIDNAIDALADDHATAGAECLVELAHKWASAGLPKDSFNNIRQFIINEAKSRDQCPMLIDSKLKLSEQQLLRQRNGTSTVIYTH